MPPHAAAPDPGAEGCGSPPVADPDTGPESQGSATGPWSNGQALGREPADGYPRLEAASPHAHGGSADQPPQEPGQPLDPGSPAAEEVLARGPAGQGALGGRGVSAAPQVDGNGARDTAAEPGSEISRGAPGQESAPVSRPPPAGPGQVMVGESDGPGAAPVPDLPATGPEVRLSAHPGAELLRPEGPGQPAWAERAPSFGPQPPSVELQLARRVDDPAWRDELGERVLWLLGRRESLAELRLNSPELGSLEIRIRQERDSASVHILVQSGSAREALESGLPRLRELFGEAGLALQRLDVAERQAGQRGDGGPGRGPGGGPAPMEGRPAGGEGWLPLGQGEGLIDTYA